MLSRITTNIFYLAFLALILVSFGCSSHQPLKFNVHTEPEGAHIIYKLGSARWVYLGVTPLDAVEVIAEDDIEDNQTFAIKALRCGYLEQVREWTGESLLDEHDAKGMIFWTPRLVKDN